MTETPTSDVVQPPVKAGGGIWGGGFVAFVAGIAAAAAITVTRHQESSRYGEQGVGWLEAMSAAATIAGPFITGGLLLMGIGAAVTVLRRATPPSPPSP